MGPYETTTNIIGMAQIFAEKKRFGNGSRKEPWVPSIEVADWKEAVGIVGPWVEIPFWYPHNILNMSG